jgi:transcriptional regulator with XRE-family HTH domain
MGRENPPLPFPVQRALRKLGTDLRDARRRRRIPMAQLAERALITRQTLHKVERGDPGVSLGIYATVLFVLGFIERLAELVDPRFDRLGLQLEEEQLPQRIHEPKPDRPKRRAPGSS